MQCLEDFGIPIDYSHTVTRVVGKPRMEGLWYAPVDENRRPVLSEEKFVACDCLLLSVGLIPENDLLHDTDVRLNPVTSGADVDENRMTSVEGIFSCGNVLHVHDLVDNVSHEAETAGKAAAEYALGKLPRGERKVNVSAGYGVRYALPQHINTGAGEVEIFFRADNVYKGVKVVVESGGKVLYSKKRLILAPGEMEKITVDKSAVTDDVTVRLER